MARAALLICTFMIWTALSACAWAQEAGTANAGGAPGQTVPAVTSSPEAGQTPKGTEQLPEIVVEERSDSLVGIAETSTQGTIGNKELEERPISRPGEVLEAMPGVIVTQHSGDGKANQYFLRGFNLDHGTDLASFVNGIPINLPSNAHGEGYTDLNFLIPELIQKIDYQKGPYFVNVGDFGSAGSEFIQYFQTLPHGIAKIEYGSWNYERGLLADSVKLGPGNFLFGFETVHTDGPWDVPENYKKFNGVLTYSQGNKSEGFSITAMGLYEPTWNATNQIPERGVAEGLFNRFANLSPTDGGFTDRYSLVSEWHQANKEGATQILAYAYYYNMGLWNDFTWFLNDPVNGDQFEQRDQRWVQGIRAHHTWFGTLNGQPMENTVGLDFRNDVITDGLYHTADRNVLNIVRKDDIVETDLAPYFENKVQWLSKFRTVLGLRADAINFNNKNLFTEYTNGPDPVNSGNRLEAIPEPKVSLIFGPWYQTEFYLNGGQGFHTDDTRGATISQDPVLGISAKRALPIARQDGAEVGARTTAIPHLQSTLTFWMLWSQSELIFDGDSGTTEPSPSSSVRKGVEFANYYTPTKWLTIDADFATSTAFFQGSPTGGNYVPEAANTIINTGITLHDIYGFSTSLRLRYFGPRPLTQDGTEWSRDTALVYYMLGYKFNKTWSARMEIFNLLNTKADDVTYYYTSRLQGEPAQGINDFTFHPAEPRTFRFMLTANF